MPLQLAFATPEDAARIAEIQMAAFGPNAMLRAQFPSPEARRALQGNIENRTLAEIENPKMAVLVARDVPSLGGSPPVTVAFAKWSLPIERGEEYTVPPRVLPEGADMGVLNAWKEVVEKASDKVIGSDPCYSLSFIGKYPSHQRRGAASMLMRWAMERSRKDGRPLYLESTIEAVPSYEKLGFRNEDMVSLECVSAETGRLTYREAIFTFNR